MFSLKYISNCSSLYPTCTRPYHRGRRWEVRMKESVTGSREGTLANGIRVCNCKVARTKIMSHCHLSPIIPSVGLSSAEKSRNHSPWREKKGATESRRKIERKRIQKNSHVHRNSYDSLFKNSEGVSTLNWRSHAAIMYVSRYHRNVRR